MRLRALLTAGLVAGGAMVAVTAPGAAAYCDPKYYPLCTNDCYMQPPPNDPTNLNKLRDWLIRVCPQ